MADTSWIPAPLVHLRSHLRWRLSPRRKLLTQMPRGAVCAEIGVWRGEFSERILQHTNPRKLHLIDPWLFQPHYPRRTYGGRVAGNQPDMDCIFEDVATRFRHTANVVLHRGRSADVLPQFDDGYFDWVYIDGDHSFEAVLADLRMCFAKTKSDGVIAGDDFTWSKREGYPVSRAVQEFVEQTGLQDRLTLLGSQFMIRPLT